MQPAVVAVWRACWCVHRVQSRERAVVVTRVAVAFSFLRWNCASAPRPAEPPWWPLQRLGVAREIEDGSSAGDDWQQD